MTYCKTGDLGFGKWIVWCGLVDDYVAGTGVREGRGH